MSPFHPDHFLSYPSPLLHPTTQTFPWLRSLSLLLLIQIEKRLKIWGLGVSFLSDGLLCEWGLSLTDSSKPWEPDSWELSWPHLSKHEIATYQKSNLALFTLPTIASHFTISPKLPHFQWNSILFSRYMYPQSRPSFLRFFSRPHPHRQDDGMGRKRNVGGKWEIVFTLISCRCHHGRDYF